MAKQIKQYSTEIISFTYKNTEEEIQNLMKWVRANLELKNQVTVLIKKSCDNNQSKLNSYFGLKSQQQINLKPQFQEKYESSNLIDPKDLPLVEQIENLLKKGESSENDQQFDNSLIFLHKAEELSTTLEEGIIKQQLTCQIFLNLSSVYQSKLNKPYAATYMHKFYEELKDNFEDSYIEALNELSQYHFDRKELTEAQEFYNKLLTLIDSLQKEKSSMKEIQLIKANTLYDLGKILILDQKKQYANGIEHFEKSIQILKQIYGDNHISIANKLHNLGEAYRQIQDYNSAFEKLKESLEIKRKEYQKPHKSVALTLYQIGLTLQKQKKWDDALKYGLEAIEIMQDKDVQQVVSVIEEMEIQGRINQMLGEIYQSTKNNPEALKYYQVAFQQLKETLGDNHKDTLRCNQSYANVLYVEKKNVEANQAFVQLADAYKNMNRKDKTMLEIYKYLIQINMNLKNPIKGTEYLNEAKALADQLYKPNDPEYSKFEKYIEDNLAKFKKLNS